MNIKIGDRVVIEKYWETPVEGIVKDLSTTLAWVDVPISTTAPYAVVSLSLVKKINA